MHYCDYCKRLFSPTRKNQKYCTDSDCRRHRKREWQKKKLRSDPDYRAAQRAAQKRWQSLHPEYWQSYRKNHAEYTDRNRCLQSARNKKRMAPKNGASETNIAKMDAKPSFLSGTYYIFPQNAISQDLIAKMDAKLFEIQPVIKKDGKRFDCKERTHTHQY